MAQKKSKKPRPTKKGKKLGSAFLREQFVVSRMYGFKGTFANWLKDKGY